MSVSFEVNAEKRDDLGKGASRRLRRAGKVPAILYGGSAEPVALTLDHDAMVHSLESESFYSHILTIQIDGQGSTQAVLKDLQRHPAKPIILHMDFQRVSADQKIRVHVPLHFVGQEVAPGAKQGGVVTHNMNEVEVSCLPKDLPEFIEADVSTLEMGHSLHLSELTLPAGVELVELSHGTEHDLPVASIQVTRASSEAEEAEGEEGGEGEGE